MSTPMELHSQRIDQVLARAPVVPVLSITRIEDAVPLARALVAGGLPVLEVTLRTEAAIGAIRAIRDEVPEASVGAGTVLNARHLSAIEAAGFRPAPPMRCMPRRATRAFHCCQGSRRRAN